MRNSECGVRNERQTATALTAENAENGGYWVTAKGNGRWQMPNAECRMPNAECQMPKANGNGGSLKGSDSTAWGNQVARQRPRSPDTPAQPPNQALSLRTPGRKAARAAHTGRMPGRTGKGRDQGAAEHVMPPCQGLLDGGIVDPGRWPALADVSIEQQPGRRAPGKRQHQQPRQQPTAPWTHLPIRAR